MVRRHRQQGAVHASRSGERDRDLDSPRGSTALCCALFLLMALATAARADDWPTYNHDARRSAVSADRLDLASLRERWVYAPRMPARPAWPGPAVRDYSNTPTIDNEDRLDFDDVYHVAAVGNSVYFGSSGEDALRCLDARTGEPRWAHCADGPVRMAPHVVDDRAYFGADDGCVYCVGASDGSLIWKQRLPASDYTVPSDGRVISLWPCRTSVLVQDGVAYCGAGIFPGEGAFICALDAATGSDAGPGRYRLRFTDVSLQGYVLASATRLYFPGGRAAPAVIDRRTGARQGKVGGGGGTYALVTAEDSIVYGPGANSALLEEFSGGGRDRLASFPGGRHIIVTPERSYISTRERLFSLDRARYVRLTAELAHVNEQLKPLSQDAPEYAPLVQKRAQLEQDRQGCTAWSTPSPLSEALILVGEHVLAGGEGSVTAFEATTGAQVWSAAVDGTAKGLAAARGRLFVSTDTRRIYCFE